MEQEGEEEEETETKPDPLHQLILHFSRTALTEKRWDSFSPSSILVEQLLDWIQHISTFDMLPKPLFLLFCYSKLDTDYLYMAYADIMAKVSYLSVWITF